MKLYVATNGTFFAQQLQNYLEQLKQYSRPSQSVPYQVKILQRILRRGYASAYNIRDDLGRKHKGWSDMESWSLPHVTRQLRNIHKKDWIRVKDVPSEENPHNHKFFELSTAGLHFLLSIGAVNDLEYALKYWPDNEIFWLFLYPFFSQETFARPTPKLREVLLERYFPTLCGVIELILKGIEQKKIERSKDDLELVWEALLSEQVNLQLNQILFLIDQETVGLLSHDELFKRRLRFIRKIYDRRYNEIVGSESHHPAHQPRTTRDQISQFGPISQDT